MTLMLIINDKDRIQINKRTLKRLLIGLLVSEQRHKRLHALFFNMLKPWNISETLKQFVPGFYFSFILVLLHVVRAAFGFQVKFHVTVTQFTEHLA